MGRSQRVVSVPSRGAMFLNKEEAEEWLYAKGFRPLAGSYVS